MRDIMKEFGLPGPAPAAPRWRESLGGPALLFLGSAGVVFLGLICVMAMALHERPPARPLLFPVEHAEEPRVLATSITPITSTSDGASGLRFSGDAYDVTCTVSTDTVTLYAAAHDGSAWRVFDDTAKTLAVGSGRTARFPADRASGLQWNVYKEGAGSVASCTARQAYGPISRPPASSGGGAPAAHASTHEDGGDDEVALDASQITSGILDVARGSTGFSTYSAGDLLYASGSNALGKLAIGNDGAVLKVSSGSPTWGSAPFSFVVTGYASSVGDAATRYLCGTSGDACSVAATVNQNRLGLNPISTSSTLSNLNCKLKQASGGGKTVTITVQTSGDGGTSWSDTTLACAIVDPATTCVDSLHAPSASQYDVWAIKTVSASGDASSELSCAFRVNG